MQKINEILNESDILIQKHEHVMNMFFRFSKWLAIYWIFVLLISYIGFLTNESIVFIFIGIIFYIVSALFYIRIFYNQTFIAVTNKKIVKSVRNGLFSSHIIELPLSRVRQIRADNNGLIPRIFGYWNIEIQAYEESSNMYFKALKNNKKTLADISKILENIKKIN